MRFTARRAQFGFHFLRLAAKGIAVSRGIGERRGLSGTVHLTQQPQIACWASRYFQKRLLANEYC